MKRYRIVDDSGVDYSFIRAFGITEKSWLGQVVEGYPSAGLPEHITVKKPFGIAGTFTADAECFEEITEEKNEA